MRVGWRRKSFQVRQHCGYLGFRGPSSKQGRREGFLNACAQIVLPSMPCPRACPSHIVQTGSQLGRAVGVVVESVEVEPAGMAIHMTSMATEPLVMRSTCIIEEGFALPGQARL